ncbi:MAG TPA: PilZ domain-containing protein [Vicinamibacteria bacterium]|nr:PilZ domain-containing protein [Vicinamibacteria bacterium]
MPSTEPQYTTPRKSRRLAPRRSATAALYQGEQQFAYGVVTNVSLSGACIVTDGSLSPGMDVGLKLSFYDQPRLIETGARVVWNRRAARSDVGLEGHQLNGVVFTLTAPPERARLAALLHSDGFELLYDPDTTEFDRLQHSLASELAQLGDKLGKTVGSRESEPE